MPQSAQNSENGDRPIYSLRGIYSHMEGWVKKQAEKRGKALGLPIVFPPSLSFIIYFILFYFILFYLFYFLIVFIFINLFIYLVVLVAGRTKRSKVTTSQDPLTLDWSLFIVSSLLFTLLIN